MVTWQELARLSDEELAALDIAAVNLACAAGLPDADIDTAACLRKLDQWAGFVQWHTERVMPEFRRNPHDYNNSEAYYRMLCMVSALQRHLGLRYNPEKIPHHVPLDTVDVFIHGPVLGNGGTCVSLAVAYVAVGRRLRYPLKLVATRSKKQNGHLFVRWDAPGGERFNIESAGRGLLCESDDFYRAGLYDLPPDVEAAGRFLKSKTPKEELAGFLSERAHRWLDYGNFAAAADSFAWAAALAPANATYLHTVKMTLNEWMDKLDQMKPPGFPKVYVAVNGRRYPDAVPFDVELRILGCHATSVLLKSPEHERKYWGPLRAGHNLTRMPVRVVAEFTETGMEMNIRYAEAPLTLYEGGI